ncbi:MAG: hypothetical protein RSD32_09515, partial [Oscillospiraceae bacterium]
MNLTLELDRDLDLDRDLVLSLVCHSERSEESFPVLDLIPINRNALLTSASVRTGWLKTPFLF